MKLTILNIKHLFTVCFTLFAVSIAGEGMREDLSLAGVEKCSKITEDRLRLACFDHLFNVPIVVTPIVNAIDNRELDQYHPEEWGEIHSMEKKRLLGEDDFMLSVVPNHFIDSIFITKPIQGLGIIVFSCVDKISRVELMLNTQLEEGIVMVEVEKNKHQRLQERWLSDDSGYILRMGRGIPSINWMKNILNESQIILHMKQQNFSLSLDGLDEKIKRLRQTCTW